MGRNGLLVVITLPEGEEDDRLDGKELEYGVEGLEHLSRRSQEQEQPVESQ